MLLLFLSHCISFQTTYALFIERNNQMIRIGLIWTYSMCFNNAVIKE
jgi:hypothetical protein